MGHSAFGRKGTRLTPYQEDSRVLSPETENIFLGCFKSLFSTLPSYCFIISHPSLAGDSKSCKEFWSKRSFGYFLLKMVESVCRWQKGSSLKKSSGKSILGYISTWNIEDFEQDETIFIN